MFRVAILSLLAVVPASTNYALPSYDFGNGADSGSSASYQLNSSVGADGENLSGTSYKLPAGIRSSTTVAAPAAPSFTNPDDSYDRLKITLQTAGAPADTKYAIAISKDNFVTTKYVQPDQTVGPSFAISNYQTYAAWGGASGCWILGLENNTAYQVKVAALQGKSTGGKFGPIASAATSVPSVTFGISTSQTSTPPFSVAFPNLPADSVSTGSASINSTITTNSKNGGQVLVHGQYAGLHSNTTGSTLASTTADLSSVGGGYGAQVTSTAQVSGGPLTARAPYNGTGNAVGFLSTSWQAVADFNVPINSGSISLALKARADGSSLPATDYSDSLTISISLIF